MNRIYDITRTVSPSTHVWPEDTPYAAQYAMTIANGDSVNLTTVTTTAHIGTHADAYFHYEAEGAYINAMPLAAYIGPARVVTVSKPSGALIPADFDHIDLTGGQRLLIHSHVSDLPDDQWPDAIVYPSPELIAWLADMDYVLIGLDSPSVDALESTDLPGHHAIHQHNMVNLEGLMLKDVPDGDYELVALPLKLDLACGSPVRAILRSI